MRKNVFNQRLNKRNRISAQQPRGHSSWCRGCDAAKTRDGQKCPVCGYKENDRKRLKKVGPLE